jgi:hypothetical protein
MVSRLPAVLFAAQQTDSTMSTSRAKQIYLHVIDRVFTDRGDELPNYSINKASRPPQMCVPQPTSQPSRFVPILFPYAVVGQLALPVFTSTPPQGAPQQQLRCPFAWFFVRVPLRPLTLPSSCSHRQGPCALSRKKRPRFSSKSWPNCMRTHTPRHSQRHNRTAHHTTK